MRLREIRNDFEYFFQNHAQVKHIFWGGVEDYTAITDKLYYSVSIEYISSSYSGKLINHGFNISISDIMDLNYPETEFSAVDNCLMIAQDFLAYLYEKDYGYTQGNIQPFRESTGDITAGVVLPISITQPIGLNYCTVPNTN